MALEEFRTKFGKAMMELTGTLVLVITVQLSAGFALAPIAVAIALIAAIYSGGPISGGHLNPAISLSVFCRGKLSLQDLITYWIFQIGGGLLGALLGALIRGKLFAVQLGEGAHLLQAFLAEFIFTAILCFVVLATATSSRVQGNTYYAAAIGFVVLAGMVAVGDISGGAFNPAIVLGLNIIKHFWKIGYTLWVLLAQLLGGVAGAIIYYIVDPEEFAHFGQEAHTLVEEARSLLPRREGQ